MVVAREIGTYEVLMISGYGNGDQIGFLYFNEPSGWVHRIRRNHQERSTASRKCLVVERNTQHLLPRN